MKNELGKKKAVGVMRAQAAMCVKKLNAHSFNSDENIFLGNDLTDLSDMYQKGTIFYKEYKKYMLPSEDELQKDLADMLEIYEEYYEKIYKSQLNSSM